MIQILSPAQRCPHEPMRPGPQALSWADMIAAQRLEEAIVRIRILAREPSSAIELALRIGAEDGASSPWPTHEVVQRYLDVLARLAARGEPLPTTAEALRERERQEQARDVFAMLGAAGAYWP